MTENECLSKMVAPGTRRPGKFGSGGNPAGGGVIQILVTHSCDKACVNCTQASNTVAPRWEMDPDQFEQACLSLKGYFGVVGVFGGNPATSTQFHRYCEILRAHFPKEQRGLWCNNPLTLDKAAEMRRTFNPAVSNLNCHMDVRAYTMFKQGWPESMPFGHNKESSHSPPWVAMTDVDRLPVFDAKHNKVGEMDNTEPNRLKLIADCDINQHWSAGIGVFRGELRAWFCEIAMAQSIRHQHEPEYPDTGYPVIGHGTVGDLCGIPNHGKKWWELGMVMFAEQVRKHCHECGVPLRGHGAIALTDPTAKEQVSKTHIAVYRPKPKSRAVELVTTLDQLGAPVKMTTRYLQNA